MLKNFLPIIADMVAGALVLLPPLLVWLCWAAKKRRLWQKLAIVLFGLYLLAICSVVGIPSIKYLHIDPSFNLLPLIDIVDNPPGYIVNTILNIILFMPLGVLLPVIWPVYRSLGKIALAGLGFSLSIELIQIFSWRLTDVDDLLTNTLGAVLGFLLVSFLYKLWKKQPLAGVADTAEQGSQTAAVWEPWLIWLGCLLITIFVQPFLPEPVRNWFLYTPFWQ